jgi:putative acetyltransferase
MSNDPATVRFDIRPATPADAEGICRMHVESIRVVCAADYSPEQIEVWAGPKRPQDYVDYIQHGSTMFVAEADGEIVGFGALYGDEVKAVYVSPRTQRMGIGRALLATLEREAIHRGITTIKLESTITAQRFYESQGFAQIAPTVHCMCGVDVPCIAMTKDLDRSSR